MPVTDDKACEEVFFHRFVRRLPVVASAPLRTLLLPLRFSRQYQGLRPLESREGLALRAPPLRTPARGASPRIPRNS